MSTANKIVLKELVQAINDNANSVLLLRHKLKEAVNQQVDLNEKLNRGRTLMHFAVMANRKGLIKLLAAFNVSPLICDDDFNTPLHLAVLKKKYQALQELLKLGIDIDAPGEFEQTPLHVAVTSGNLEMVKLLIANGADYELVDERNLTPLQYAIDENDQSIIDYLRKVSDIKKGI